MQSYAAEARLDLRGQSLFTHCSLLDGESRELAFATSVLAARPPAQLSDAELNRLINEGMKMVTMHEIGHDLGLRHNFKGSTMLSLKDLNDPEKVKEIGMGRQASCRLLSRQHRPQGNQTGELLHAHDRAVRRVGYPIWLHADSRWRHVRRVARG